jgi:lipid-A-disaccharide synthase-like uncharacterized protein
MNDVGINDILGWTGAFFVLLAYGLLSVRRLRAEQPAYHWMNLAGSLMLAIYALNLQAHASVVVNVIWLLIAIWALLQAWLRTKR